MTTATVTNRAKGFWAWFKSLWTGDETTFEDSDGNVKVADAGTDGKGGKAIMLIMIALIVGVIWLFKIPILRWGRRTARRSYRRARRYTRRYTQRRRSRRRARR